MRVVAQELVRLSGTTLDASVTLSEDWAGERTLLTVPDTAAGDTLQGPAVAAAAGRVLDAAELAIGRVVATLQEDADDLLVIAFDVTHVDQDVARNLSGAPLLRTGAV